MKRKLVDLLRCTGCGSGLELTAAQSEQIEGDGVNPAFEEVTEGELRCLGCGAKYPVTRGIPRFTPSDSYVGNFSVQWQKLRSSTRPPKLNRAAEHYRKRTDFDLARVTGEWVLEAGCGAGRYVRILADHGAEIVGVDLSFGVDEVYKAIGRRPNVHLVQASIFQLPFKDGAFDKVYSLGVLHHTPSTKKAFDCLPRLLKPGGRLCVWVYSRHDMIPWKFGGYYRKITTRLPPRLLYYLCYVAVPMHYIYKIPLLGRLAFIVLRTDGHHPDWRFRVLNTFDYYAPKYQFLHTYSEVFGWFEEHGLEKIRVLPAPVALAGSRPTGATAITAPGLAASPAASAPAPAAVPGATALQLAKT
jgi:SAM-dependent methyltransferase